MRIEADNITVVLGGLPVLVDLDFEAEAGDVTVILGQNGSGKTTLTRTLIGELRPAKGQVRINGHDVSTLKPSRMARMRAVLPQTVSLSFPFTVREVVRLGVEAGGGSLSPHAAIDACLAKVGLSGYAGRKIHQLSGGEQQRVHLARVLAQVLADDGEDGPRWLFLDEPVSSLDLKHQIAVMETARDFARSGGGVIAVLHDINLAARYADSVFILGQDGVIASGAPDSVMTSRTISDCYGVEIAVENILDRQYFVPA
jgi:iron complex transport system ATP-binding protein